MRRTLLLAGLMLGLVTIASNEPLHDANANKPAEARKPSTGTANEDGMFAVEMKDGTRFAGKPVNMDAVPLYADFGRIRVPLKLIDGFEPAKQRDSTKVHFKNGDTLTAKIELRILALKTRYGQVDVPLGEVARVLAGTRFSEPEDKEAKMPKNVMHDPGNLTMFGGYIGKSLYFRVTGVLVGSVWGTDVYTADSRLAPAAVHAGAVKLGETAIVKVTFVPGPPAHAGSTRNGIVSRSYGTYSFSYKVEKLKRDKDKRRRPSLRRR